MNDTRDLDFLNTLADFQPNMSIAMALDLLDRTKGIFGKPIRTMRDLNTHEGRISWVQENPTVMALIRDNKKIQAIKETRLSLNAYTGVLPGLKECKDAVDAVMHDMSLQALREKLSGQA